MHYTYDDSAIKGLYREATGITPGTWWIQNWAKLPSAKKQELWDYLLRRSVSADHNL
jgi:hypothetical protein